MKIYYIEDNLFHQELFKKERMKYHYLRSLEVIIFPTNKLETIYKTLGDYTFSSADIFVLDIDLKSLHTGIDFAKKFALTTPIVLSSFYPMIVRGVWKSSISKFGRIYT